MKYGLIQQQIPEIFCIVITLRYILVNKEKLLFIRFSDYDITIKIKS